MISGIFTHFLGAAVGGLSFISSYKYFTYYFFELNQHTKHNWDFRLKNIVIYLISDVCAGVSRIFFEARKQLLQMCEKDIALRDIFKGCYLGLFPLLLRDTLFRTTILTFYYATTHIEHKPQLKYTVPQITYHLKALREKGYDVTFTDMKYVFFEYQNYDVKTKVTTRFLLLIFASLLATIITNPIDVCLTKLITQRNNKYTGLIDCLRQVYKQEGKIKFFSGLHPRFMFNIMNGVMFLYVYDRFIEKIKKSQE